MRSGTQQFAVKLESDHRKRPLVHLLRADGSMAATFRHSIVAVPDDPHDEKAGQVYAVLVNGHGEQLYQEDGSPAVVQAMPMMLFTEWQPDKLLSEREVCYMLDLSPSTIDRRTADKTFPSPVYTSERRKSWRWGDLKEWIAAQPRSFHEQLYGGMRADRSSQRSG